MCRDFTRARQDSVRFGGERFFVKRESWKMLYIRLLSYANFVSRETREYKLLIVS